MPFPFTLPTTSSILLSQFVTSATHPSLPLTVTTRRSVVKDALKRHKRLSPQEKASHLPSVQGTITEYLPCLLALNAASGYRDIGTERVEIEVIKPVEVEWRTTLSATIPGREAPRTKLTGLHHEVAFTLSTLASVHSLLARSQLKTINDSTVLSSEQRTTAYVQTMKHLLEAYKIYTFLLSLPSVSAATDAPVDIQPSTISALASLCLAEASLAFVSKDDPYTAAAADVRNERNTDWMFKAPTIVKVRAHLFARISLAAAEHASQASGLLSRSGSDRIDGDLVDYANNLRRTAKARAARFLAIDKELSGETGEALAWLKGAKRELGLSVQIEDGKRKGLRGLKQSWQEHRESKKIEKGGEWGMDAGRIEEAQVLEMLEIKWDKENSTINVQIIPPFEPLLASMPSGRDPHPPQPPYQPPSLDVAALAQMRAPPDPNDQGFRGDEEDSGSESYARNELPGAFPGLPKAEPRATQNSSYY